MSDDFVRLMEALADHYAIEREIGSGGMAVVYLAEDVKHRRKVASGVSACARWISSRFVATILSRIVGTKPSFTSAGPSPVPERWGSSCTAAPPRREVRQCNCRTNRVPSP